MTPLALPMSFEHMIKKLDNSTLRIIAIRKLEGYSVQEISAELGTSTQNHRSQAQADPRPLGGRSRMTSRPTLDTQLAAADLQIIDAICDRFEADHRTGRLVDLASYLSEAPPGCRAVLFRELLNLDLEFRHENGEQPDARSYHRQFPDLGEAIDAAFESRANRISTVRRGRSNDRDGDDDHDLAGSGRDRER